MQQDSNLNNADGKELAKQKNDFLVVGIGASAGGILALSEFFKFVPADSGMVYVVILHLSPDHDSRLAEVLQTTARIPVTQVREAVRIEPDRVYVIPPDKSLTIADGQLAVSDVTGFEERRSPVDIFFRSLAEFYESRAVGVILSGTGANGSMGIKRIKEKGGVCFVQDPHEAEYDEMPRNSMATDLIDGVLPVSQIPEKILDYKQRLQQTKIVPELARQNDSEEANEAALREIFLLMRRRTGHDFSNYKRLTLLRRLERRMNLRQIADLPAYARFLSEEGEETSFLLKDLLISVTNFFRDRQAFDRLETEIIPRILHRKKSGDAARVWVAGCATGEEAYSIAILLAEGFETDLDQPVVQIFATDIDERAISHARSGFYTEADAADVSPERLRRFFNREPNGYRVKREIRESVLFAAHNVIKDPAFSHLDLVTCRNLLIYFDRTAQRRAIQTFHFALKPGGYLFLGSSESLEQVSDGFVTIDKESRLFQSRSHPAPRSVPIPDVSPTLNFDRAPIEPLQLRHEPRVAAAPRPLEQTAYQIHQRLLERYAPPSIVVGENYDIIHISERAGRYLQMPGGEMTHNLLLLVLPELRSELRAALFQAAQSRETIEIRGIEIRSGADSATINLIVNPVSDENDSALGCFLIIFETAEESAADSNTKIVRAARMNVGEIALNAPLEQQFETELARIRTELRSTIEQYEVQNEEMKASNEELQAMNEELRSASEELEASKEELQSLNEELSTVNQELKIKIEELSHANSDFQNLMAATSIATIFLDRGLNIKHFTPPAQEIFNILPVDLGRPLANLTGKLVDPNLHADVERVLNKLQSVEREVLTTDDRSYLMQLLPYRTLDDRINGVVLSFVDITARKRAEAAKFYLASIVESSEDSMLTVDLNGTITSWNRASEKLYGYSASEAVGKPLTMLTLPEDLAEVVRNADKIAHSHEVEIYDTIRVNKDGREMNLEVVLSPVKDASGAVIGVSTIARDVTERRLAQAAKFHLAAIVESSQDSMVSIDLEGVITSWNRAAEQLYGYSAAEAIGKTLTELTLPQNLLEVLGNIENVRHSQRVEIFDSVRLHKDSREIHLEVVMSPVKDEAGQVIGVSTLARDVTERRRAQETLRQSEERKTFLLGLTDALRSLGEPLQVLEKGLKRVGEYLDLDRVVYNEIDPEVTTYTTRVNYLKPGFSSLVGSVPLAPFRETVRDLEKGITYVQPDVEKDDKLSAAEKQVCRSIQTQAFVTVPLVKRGQWVCNLVSHSGKPRRWTEYELAIMEESADRIWSAFERAKAEEALSKSEEKYRTLFDSIDEAVAWFEMITDENGNPLDYRLLEVNPAYSNMSGGLIAENSVGKTAKELVPNIEQSWIDTVAKAAFGGESIRTEQHVKDLNSWFQVYVSPVGDKRDGQFVALYSDITTRKRTEANLALLAEIAEDFARLASEAEIMQRIGERLAKHLRLDGFTFADVDEAHESVTVKYGWNASDVPIITGTFHFADYMTEEFAHTMRAGKTWVVGDTQSDERTDAEATAAIEVGAIINVPYHLRGEWQGCLTAMSRQPRDWTADEIALIEEVSNRTFPRLERARAEEALRESETLLQQAFTAARAFGFSIDLATREIKPSGSATDALGFEMPLDEAERFAYVHPDDRERTREAFETALSIGSDYKIEHRLVNPATGETVWVRVDAEFFPDENRLVGSVRNITERKQAEEALHESEERLRLAVEVSELATWEWNLETNEVFWNEQHFILFGMPPHANPVAPEEFFNHVHPDDLERIEKALNKAISERSLFDDEFRAVLDTGETRWMSGYGRVTESQRGEAAVMSGLMFDINERRQMEEDLRTSSERLRLLIESASDYAIFTTTLDSRIDSWNQGAEKIFGWTETEALGQSGAIIFTPEDRAKGEPETEMATAIREGRAPDERFHLRKDGSRFYVSGVMNLLRDAAGNARGFVKICRDMTERIEAEKVLRDKEMLQKLVSAQEDERKRIARDLHDELGQQMTALRLQLESARKLCEDETICGKIDEIQTIAKQIDNGVDFLAWELRPAALDDLGLYAALEKYVNEWSHYSGVTAELMSSTLKKARFAPETETNLYRIAQEALNNAHKHAEAKSVEVVLEKRGETIVLILADDGKGFDLEDKNNRSKGMGLIGMRERAALIGGSLEIESAPGEGTTVYARAPVSERKKENENDE